MFRLSVRIILGTIGLIHLCIFQGQINHKLGQPQVRCTHMSVYNLITTKVQLDIVNGTKRLKIPVRDKISRADKLKWNNQSTAQWI